MGIRVTDTAAAIARVRAEESRLPNGQRLFEDQFAPLFAGDHSTDELVERFLSVPFFRLQVRLRTRFIDDVVREAVEEGVRQVVILGAGFDCRALRLAEIERSSARTFEIDLPEQLDIKRIILRQAGVSVSKHILSIPCDFSSGNWESSLLNELLREKFNPLDPALIICEGVISYLTHSEISRALCWVARLGGKKSRSIFNYTVAWITTERMAELITDAGFTRLDDSSLLDLHQRYLSGDPPPGGDNFRIAVAWS